MENFCISIIVPCYNEEANVAEFYNELKNVLQGYRYEILFINDGSADHTLKAIKGLAENNGEVKYISFTRNFGQQLALKAGIDFAVGDCLIMMDADLQHPPQILLEMIAEWRKGFEIVYTEREYDMKESFLKRSSSSLFYKILNMVSDFPIDKGTADFRLIDKKVADVIRKISEPEIFLRGYMSWMGFKKYVIRYKARVRKSGQTKYGFLKMFKLALSGITSFSTRPLQISIILGTIVSLFSVLNGIVALYTYFFTDKALSGYTSIMLSVLLLGGVQLIMLGILGEYVGRIFVQTKNRPTYIADEVKLD